MTTQRLLWQSGDSHLFFIPRSASPGPIAGKEILTATYVKPDVALYNWSWIHAHAW